MKQHPRCFLSRGSGSIPDQSMWDFCCTKWQWDRLFSKYFGCPLLSYRQCTIFIFCSYKTKVTCLQSSLMKALLCPCPVFSVSEYSSIMYSFNCIYCNTTTVFKGYTWQQNESKVGDKAGLTLGGTDWGLIMNVCNCRMHPILILHCLGANQSGSNLQSPHSKVARIAPWNDTVWLWWNETGNWWDASNFTWKK